MYGYWNSLLPCWLGPSWSKRDLWKPGILDKFINTCCFKKIENRPILFHKKAIKFKIMENPTNRLFSKSENQGQEEFLEIPVVLPYSLIKIRGKSVLGFMSYDQTSKQRDRQSFIAWIVWQVFLNYWLFDFWFQAADYNLGNCKIRWAYILAVVAFFDSIILGR